MRNDFSIRRAPRSDGCAVFRFSGSLDRSAVPAFNEQLERALQHGPAVLDLRSATGVDAFGAGELISLLRRYPGRLFVTCPGANPVRSSLELVEDVPVYGDVDSAARALRAGRIARPDGGGAGAGGTYGNRVLDALPIGVARRVENAMSIVRLDREGIGEARRRRADTVHFPIDAVISVIAVLNDGTVSEVVSIGQEGFVEADAMLGDAWSERTSFCRIGGRAVAMTADAFRELMRTETIFTRLVRRSLRARMFVTEQISACNVRHSLLQRASRWFLTARRQCGREVIPVTHELMAMMLGTRRPTVTAAAATLEREGAIAFRRGSATIVNPEKLAATACECAELAGDAVERGLELTPR